MARIRSIKPEFFRNEKLYEAEVETGLPLRVAYAGLWTAADREGRFKWSPRELKLDCLPFDDIDFSRVLHALSTRHYIIHYASPDGEFGYIPSWRKHQVINNREMASIIPQFVAGQEIIDACPTRAPRDTEKSKGKGREGKGREGSKDTAIAVADKPAASALYHAIQNSFIAKTKTFTNWAKEAEAIKRLEAYATKHTPDDPVNFTCRLLEMFWELTSGSDKFWNRQPFTPSALSSSGIFDRVVKEMEMTQPWDFDDFADTGIKL